MNSVIEKARYGRYEDNPENQRLHRVGMEYGHAAAKPEPGMEKPKQEEPKNPLERDAAALERKIADIQKNKRIWLEYEDGESRFRKVTSQLQAKLDGIREQLKKQGGATEKKEEVKETTTVKEGKQEEKETKTTEVETKKESDGEEQEEFTYRIKFDDMPDSGKVKFKKYLSNKIKNRIDESFKNLQGLDDKTIQVLHDGIVKDFNENFESMKKSERAEALYKAMKVKNELAKRGNKNQTKKE